MEFEMTYNYCDQRRKRMNAPLNKIRKEANKELTKKIKESGDDKNGKND